MGKIHSVRVSPRIVGCWEADSGYIASKLSGRSSKKIYFCFSENYRVVMLRRRPRSTASVKLSPPSNPCALPPEACSPRDLLRGLRLPCRIHRPCACICYQEESGTSAILPCDSQCYCPEEWQELYCEKVYSLNFINRLMYPITYGNIYRYLVAVGSSEVYVAPFPPSRNMSLKCEYLLKSGMESLENQYEEMMKKYNGYIPDAVNFLNSYLSVDASVIYPNGVPEGVELYMNRYVYIDFFPKDLAFNFYQVGNKFHAVVIAWFNSDDEAYRVARVAWEIRKDVVVPLLQYLKRVRDGEHLVGLLVPEEDQYTQSE